MDAYCVKCKEKRKIVNGEPVVTRSGSPATKGICPVCGSTLFRMGKTEAHIEKLATLKEQRPHPRRRGNLVIVESPAKARTVGKLLGNKYAVKASVGHVRDLLRSKLSVDVEDNFRPSYRVPNEKRNVVRELKAAAETAEQIYLATDPDREGEAIAWHLIEAAELDPERVRRVEFHEITKRAIDEAFAKPRNIDMNRVNSQQTRRILDRLVGYKISPLLWEKVRGRTSAGRVQSVALRLIVERERVIDAFVPEEYWSIEADLQKLDESLPDAERRFRAKLVKIRGEDAELKNQAEAEAVVEALEKATYVVSGVKKGERRRNPSPPYTTSTLQQEASRRLGFTARKTMAVAQQLYEGLELDSQGMVGLITYMRTDSTQISSEAQQQARRYIRENYGPDSLPEQPPEYKTRTKGAQEAHEAIRPTDVYRVPEDIRRYLSPDQYRLYRLIWQRFVASQMLPAVYDTMTIEVIAGERGGEQPYLLRASGSRLRFAGFLAVYEETPEEDAVPEAGEGVILPELVQGEEVRLEALYPEQHFTQPPPRFTEATLVKILEQHGIGRPSTYAPIISTIQQRGYVERRDKRLHPTELGSVVNDLVVEHFPDVVDVAFTAKMEEDLDQIASGEREWVPVLHSFYEPFALALARAEQKMPRVEVADRPIGEKCEKCGHDMVLRFGRYGKFVACSNFPQCKNTRPWLEKIGVRCPVCGGELVERRTRKGRVFYGCSNFPACEYSSWKKPLPQPCPACGGLLVIQSEQFAQCTACGERFQLKQLEEKTAGDGFDGSEG